MSPFASNIAFVLYKCDKTSEPYQIKILVNEIPLEMLHSNGIQCSTEKKSVCSFSKFSSMLNDFVNLDLNSKCGIKNLKNDL